MNDKYDNQGRRYKHPEFDCLMRFYKVLAIIAVFLILAVLVSCEVTPDTCRDVQVEIIRGAPGDGKWGWATDTTFTERWCWVTVHDTITQAHLMPDSPYVYSDTSYWTYSAWIKE